MTVAPDEDPGDDARAEDRPAGEALGRAEEAARAVGPISAPDRVSETARAPVAGARAPDPAPVAQAGAKTGETVLAVRDEAAADPTAAGPPAVVEALALRTAAAATVDRDVAPPVVMGALEAALAPVPGAIERAQARRVTGRPAHPESPARR